MSAQAVIVDAFPLALIGVPNSGKTALFNRLTGSRQKVANYAGVTVERKEGVFEGPSRERSYRVLDLPGAYSLTPTTLDEAITRDLLLGRLSGEAAPRFIVCVTDATNLRLNLRLVLEIKNLGIPMIVALNMSDLARTRGYQVDAAALEHELGIPVVETVAVARDGDSQLVERLEGVPMPAASPPVEWREPDLAQIERTQREVRRILRDLESLLAIPHGLLSTAPIDVDDRFVGDGYGIPTNASTEAQTLTARNEGFFVDHTYTAKAMAGLIARVRARDLDRGTALFWHTGGQVGLFA